MLKHLSLIPSFLFIRTALLSIILSMFCDSLNAQWYLQTPGGPTVSTNGLDFVSRDTGYACGQIGVYKTNDGAQSWTQVSLGITNLDQGLYHSVQFQTTTQGCIVGTTLAGFSTILMTHNSGVTWSDFTFGTTADLAHDVDFPNAQTGYVVSTGGYVQKTTNNGFSWQNIPSGTTEHLYAVEFITSQYGYISGDQTLKRTIDGGVTWTTISGPWTLIGQIQFLDSLVGYVLDDGQIFKTIDGGSSWSRITYSMGHLVDMHFLSQSIGYAINQIYLGVHKTIDGGNYWASQTADSTNQLQIRITFADDTTGYIGGMGQTIQKTTNGGGVVFFPYNDAGVDTIVSVLCAGTQAVIVDLKNFGVDTLTSAEISWSVDMAAQTPYTWTGLLIPGASMQVTLGTFNFPMGAHSISAYTYLPNSVADDRPVNDSSTVSFSTANCTFNDPGVVAATSPVAFLASPGINVVNVTMKNFGINTISSLIVQWEMNGVPQASYFWTGNLLPGITSGSLLLGNGNFVAGTNLIKAWTTNPNSSTDIYNDNDTLYYAVYCCNGPMNGTYQVCGANRDFNSFNDAVTALTACGINGPVIINVDSGMYFEKVTIPLITGASVTNQITFQALNGDSSSVVLSHAYGSIIQDELNYTLRLAGCWYVNIKSMTLTSADTFYYSVLQLNSGASYNTISHCRFLGIDDSTLAGVSGTLIKGELSTSSSETYNTIDHNYLTGAASGIYLHGSANQRESGNQILDNRIEVTFRAISLGRQQDMFVSGNTIIVAATDVASATQMSYGIYHTEPYDSVVVSGNHINMLGPGHNMGIGIRFANDPIPMLIANNFVRVTSGAVERSYAISCSTAYVRLYNNSLVITGAFNTSNAVVVLYSAGNQQTEVRNNIICTHAGGYTIECIQANIVIVSDHNDYFPLKNEYAGTVYYGLLYWQTTGLDLNSLEIIPPFISMNDLHLQSWNNQLDAMGLPLAMIADDIDNEARDLVTPDIGADEYLPSVILIVGPTDVTTGVSIFPNPATDRVTINGTVNSQWEITDVTGNAVKSGVMYTHVAEISVADLAAGIYVMSVTDESGLRNSRKLVIER